MAVTSTFASIELSLIAEAPNATTTSITQFASVALSLIAEAPAFLTAMAITGAVYLSRTNVTLSDAYIVVTGFSGNATKVTAKINVYADKYSYDNGFSTASTDTQILTTANLQPVEIMSALYAELIEQPKYSGCTFA